MFGLLQSWGVSENTFNDVQQVILNGHALSMEEALTVASIDRRHNRSKEIWKSGTGGTGWRSFCSASVIKETMTTHEAVLATEQILKSVQDAPQRAEPQVENQQVHADQPALPGPLIEFQAVRRRSRSAFDLFSKDLAEKQIH